MVKPKCEINFRATLTNGISYSCSNLVSFHWFYILINYQCLNLSIAVGGGVLALGILTGLSFKRLNTCAFLWHLNAREANFVRTFTSAFIF